MSSVTVSALRTLTVCFALVMVTFKCCKNIRFGFRGIAIIFVSDRVVPYSAGSGVKVWR